MPVVLPAATPRLRFREMTEADLSDIATLDIGSSRGPAGWIGWNQRNYTEQGCGLWIIESHAGEFIGDCGLTMQEVEGEWLFEAGAKSELVFADLLEGEGWVVADCGPTPQFNRLQIVISAATGASVPSEVELEAVTDMPVQLSIRSS